MTDANRVKAAVERLLPNWDVHVDEALDEDVKNEGTKGFVQMEPMKVFTVIVTRIGRASQSRTLRITEHFFRTLHGASVGDAVRPYFEDLIERP